MADKNVSMTLTVDVKQVDAATAAQEKLAAATQKTATAHKNLSDSVKRLNDHFKANTVAGQQAAFDAKYRSQNQAAAMAQAAASLPPGAPGGPAAPRGANRNQGQAFQAGGFASVLGIGAAFSGFNRAIDFTRQNADSPRNLTAGNFLNEAARGVPLVGGLAGILEDTIGGEVGYSNRGSRQQIGQLVDFASQQGERQRQLSALRADSASQQSDLSRQAMAARADASAASRFRETVQGTKSSFFNTQNEFGVSNEATGELRLNKIRSESELFGAQQLSSSSQNEAALAAKRVAEAREAMRLAAGQSSASDAAAQRALTAQEQGKSFFTPGQNQKLDDAAQETAARAAADRERLQTKQVELTRAENEAIKQNKIASGDLVRVAEQRKQLGEDLIAISRNELAIVKERQSALKAGAIQSVGMDEGSKMALLEATKKLKAGGIGDLTDEERSLVQGSALTQNLFNKEAEKFGRNDPLTQQIAQEAGLGTAQQNDAEIERITNQIREDTAKVNEEFRKEVSTAITASVKELSDTLTQLLNDTTQAINTAVSNARTNANQQRIS